MGAGDSKLVFKGHINQLRDEKVQTTDHEFWSVIFTSPLQKYDVYQLIEPNDVRILRQNIPSNLAILIFKCVEQLHLFAQPHNFKSDSTSARNSLLLLTRILPFVFEHDDDGFVQAVFFDGVMPQDKAHQQQQQPQQEAEQSSQEKKEPSVAVEIEQKDGSKDEVQVRIQETSQQQSSSSSSSSSSTATASDVPQQKKSKASLAEKMMATLMNIMFVPGFTVPLDAKRQEGSTGTLEKGLLWEGGLVVPADSIAAPTSELITRRTEVLRCLIACLSSSLFQQQSELLQSENKFLSLAVSDKMPMTETLFYSLLNTILNYDPSSILPYTTVIYTDQKERLVNLSVQALCALLQYKPEHFAHQQQQQQQDKPKTNVFTGYISKLGRESFPIIFNGLSTLLFNIVDANNTYLPNSLKAIPFHNEMLVLTWKLFEYNRSFAVYVCRDADVMRIVAPCLYVMQTTAPDRTQFPLFQLATFIIMMLSGNREFGVALNAKYESRLPLQHPSFTGTHADLLILVLQRLIAQDSGLLRSMYDCFLTIICNVAPYCKSLSVTTCDKLVSLFEALSMPRYLYSAEHHPKLVRLLLETFNSLIQYQYEGNSHLVYSILRKRNVFENLGTKQDLEAIRASIISRHQQQQQQQQQPLPEPFLPTEEWVQTWKPKLPLNTIYALLRTIVPEVERLVENDTASEEDIIAFLKGTTLVGLLPLPHEIVIRTFLGSTNIDCFLLTYTWSQIYLKSFNIGLWDAKKIKLFSVSLQPSS